MELRDTIKSLRKERKIQQKALAYALLVNQSTVSHWESGRQEPNTKQRKKLAKFFDITEAELFGGIPPVKEAEAEYKRASNIPVIWEVTSNNENNFELKPLESGEYINFKDCKAIKITTNSLAPFVLKGQKIIYREKAPINNSDFVFAILANGEYHFRRYFQNKRTITLQSILMSESCEPLLIQGKEIKTLNKIVGIQV
ncbi:MAG: helix-turn-helix transcriptional regulator [PVC group bacterium]|nr:helix-turn-helix transcriptional regulator [PVC group bacterium]